MRRPQPMTNCSCALPRPASTRQTSWWRAGRHASCSGCRMPSVSATTSAASSRGVGAAVADFAVGDRVAALAGNLAAPLRAHAELAAVPAASAALVPANLPLDAAATVPLNALTAAQALDLLGAPAGRTLLVTGAAGAVGAYATVLAARAGWRVTGLARESDRELVEGAGAELVTVLPEHTADAVLDAAAMQQEAIAAVVDGGAFAGVLPRTPVAPQRGIDVQAVAVTADGARLGTLLDLSASGVLPVRIAGRAPLTDAQTAYATLAAGGQRGRWLLIP